MIAYYQGRAQALEIAGQYQAALQYSRCAVWFALVLGPGERTVYVTKPRHAEWLACWMAMVADNMERLANCLALAGEFTEATVILRRVAAYLMPHFGSGSIFTTVRGGRRRDRRVAP
jgi:hypothetical protein